MQEEIDLLKQRIEALEKAQNMDATVLIFNQIDKLLPPKGYIKTSSVTDYGADLQRTITIPAGGGNFTVPENPTDSAIITASDGSQYRILLYSLT